MDSGEIIPLTKSLSIAMPYLLDHSRTEHLWVDQICFNQADNRERATEVPKMGNIFKGATHVFAWLGKDRWYGTFLSEIIDAAGELHDGPYTKYELWDEDVVGQVASLFSLSGHDPRSHVDAFCDLLDNPWLCRAWCLQEAIVSKSFSLLMGEHEFSNLRALQDVSLILQRRLDKAKEYDWIARRRGFQTLRILIDERNRFQKDFHTPIHELLALVGGYFDATDPHDLIYGFLGLQFNPNITINVNYDESTETTLIKTARAIITGTHSLDIFNALAIPPLVYPWSSQARKYLLPTWVPNWLVYMKSHLYNAWDYSRLNPFKASATRLHMPLTVLEDLLKLAIRGRFIAEITHLSSPHSNDYLNWAVHIALDDRLTEIKTKFPPFTDLSRERMLKVVLMECLCQTPRPDIKEVLRQYDILCSEDLKCKYSGSALEAWATSINNLAISCIRRRIFCTQDMKLGLTPNHSEINDKVAIIHGSRFPVVLRPTRVDGEYTIIGRCYLEGVMHGEACTWPEDEADTFILV
jgi:hypothetical protein